MTKLELLSAIEHHRLFAVIRADSSDHAVAAARALYDGGLRLLEITCTTPDAASAIARLTDARLPAAVVGAGSVFDEQTAKNVIAAGAQFVVSPVTVDAVVDACVKKEIVVLPGAATANEVQRAWALGADIVKIFPAAQLGGPAFIKALREPMPHLKLCPTGGVHEGNLLDYLNAGAVAVGVGGKLADRTAMASGDFAALTKAARRYIGILNPEPCLP